MRQAIEFPGLPAQAAGQLGWFGRLHAWLFGSRGPNPNLSPDALSAHLLRDIGVCEDVRGNHLLRDGWLRR